MKAVYLSELDNCQLFYLTNRKNARAYTKSAFELKDCHAVLIYSRGMYDIVDSDRVVYIYV